MDMTISIADEVAIKLGERAAVSGQSAPAYAARIVAESVIKPTIDELLSPVRDDFRNTRPTDDELMEVGRHALAAVRQSRQAERAWPATGVLPGFS
jgi:hypothetical protein